MDEQEYWPTRRAKIPRQKPKGSLDVPLNTGAFPSASGVNSCLILPSVVKNYIFPSVHPSVGLST